MYDLRDTGFPKQKPGICINKGNLNPSLPNFNADSRFEAQKPGILTTKSTARPLLYGHIAIRPYKSLWAVPIQYWHIINIINSNWDAINTLYHGDNLKVLLTSI